MLDTFTSPPDVTLARGLDGHRSKNSSASNVYSVELSLLRCGP